MTASRHHRPGGEGRGVWMSAWLLCLLAAPGLPLRSNCTKVCIVPSLCHLRCPPNQGNHQPECDPPCNNGGSCTANGCMCRAQNTGPDCSRFRCSHVLPCYPGSCRNDQECICTRGFTHAGLTPRERCLQLEATEANKPVIRQLRAWLRYIPGTGAARRIVKYQVMAATEREADGAASVWSNRKQFNRLDVRTGSEFSPEGLPRRPRYVLNAGFGIVRASVNIFMTRHGTIGLTVNETLSCPRRISSFSPALGIFSCLISRRFDLATETRDTLRVTFITESGGFRDLLNLDTEQRHTRQKFLGQSSSRAVEFKFDHDPPTHCSLTVTCQRRERMLSVPDLTKEPLLIQWGNWSDDVSGMMRYMLEVFLLSKVEGHLDTRGNQKPVYGPKEVNHTAVHYSQRFTPKEAGMYAVSLHAFDHASNYRHVRRLTLYDPTSSVTFDPSYQFAITSASAVSNFTYQNDTTAPIIANWTRFFRNALHEERSLLGEVRPLSGDPEDSDSTSGGRLDDREGDRTVDAIRNVRGIVRFEVAHSKHREGDGQPRPESGDWKDVGLSQTFTVPASVDNGDTVTVWVRATDAMGNQLEKSTHVTFDETPPYVEKAELEANTAVSGISYSSVFHLITKDAESGIAQVQWTITRSNGKVLYKQDVKPKLTQNCQEERSESCYCTSEGHCYLVDQSHAVSNCHLLVEKERAETEKITVTWTVVNLAGLVSSGSMMEGHLNKLNGANSYLPPQNVHITSITSKSVSLAWSLPPSCFPPTDTWLTGTDGNGNEVKRNVNGGVTHVNLTGLQPGRRYNIRLVTNYDGQTSEMQPFSFATNTEKAAHLSAGAVVGIISSTLLLVFVVTAALAYNWEKLRGKIRTWRTNMFKEQELVDISASLPDLTGFDNCMFATADEDLFPPSFKLKIFEGQPPAWKVEAKHLVLCDQLTSGKFANIYSGIWKRPGSADVTVAAKMLKAGFCENEYNQMMARIQFFATVVGSHDNILGFYGAVLDDGQLGPGPIMLLEYCERGQLNKWLQNYRGEVSKDNADYLFRFPKDIASGMTYLASRKIVHGHLGARNVLLNALLGVKIAGFGPKETTKEKTHVPVKWVAPEILEKNSTGDERSDVWSYGVTLWEIFSLGENPYPGIKTEDIHTYIRDGHRMSKPEFADDEFYKLMRDCWLESPAARPCFAEIRARLSGFSQRNSTAYSNI